MENQTLAEQIKVSTSENIVQTTLKTDERVISRVTDGIYRQPASALRELISNAYDADATRVVIRTDAPRFDRITIEDNGHGMSADALAHMIEHIGGSAKRSNNGRSLGVTSEFDVDSSPGGRKLIGKIGIGLFSVSQLTRSFQIITKIKGESFRTVATVSLKQYSDKSARSTDDDKFESGKVNIWREPASDIDKQGTLIVLTSIRPQAKDTLRSRDIWTAIEQAKKESEETGEDTSLIAGPKYHIGRVDVDSGRLIPSSTDEYDRLPWARNDSPDDSFSKLVNAVWAEVKQGNPNPQLSRIFDYYLQMAWNLALAIPADYFETHPFDITIDDPNYFFDISNNTKGGKAQNIEATNKTVREALDLSDPNSSNDSFEVYLDDLKLSRPLKFTNLPTTDNVVKRSLLFVGKCKQSFEGVPDSVSGGPLTFEAYLLWNPKIAPTEHRGSLIRINGASGTLFDPHFMRYQVAELTRLNQITCEIFVHEGLDGALNIDRESFNSAHPHTVYITKWLHSALRQLATAHKKVSAQLRAEQRRIHSEDLQSNVQKIALREWRRVSGDEGSKPPKFIFEEKNSRSEVPEKSSLNDQYVFDSDNIFPNKVKSRSPKKDDPVAQTKLEALGQLLASYGLFDQLSNRQQSELLRAIYEILVSDK